jgi:predicted dehydrogenase
MKVGIVGFGEIAQYHRRHLEAAGARVTAAMTRRPLPAGVTRYSTLGAMLPHVDAVTIAVPNLLHASLCAEAVEAHRPVFVEKPLGITEEDLCLLDRLLPHAPVPVHVGFRLRWNPWLRALRERTGGAQRIACGYRLGIERLAAGKPWTRREAESGGAWFTLGVHAFDLARWLAGAAGASLQDITGADSGPAEGADFPLVVTVRGVVAGAAIQAGADLRGDAAFALDLAIDGEPAAARGEPRPIHPEDAGAADAEYAAMMGAFVAAVRSGLIDRAAVVDALRVHRDLLEARSLARGLTRRSPSS